MTRQMLRTLTLAATCGLAVSAEPVSAQQKLKFHFAPPQIEVEPICTARPPDEQTTALWENWTAKACPRWKPRLLSAT